jgi:uroporphyrinogen decarboxylase
MKNNSHHRISGKELLLATLRHEKMDEVPWVPFAGVHAGKLMSYPAQDVLTDEDKLFQSLVKVNDVYDPDGQPIIFDLQIEAEILGCELVWTKNGPPMVASHPFETRKKIPASLPNKMDGRLPMILNVMRKMKKERGDRTALYGLITGPLTLASHLRGTEIFMDTFDNPDYLISLLDFCKDTAVRMAEFYIDAGMDVIAVVDPVVSQVSPRHFKQFLSAPFSCIFKSIREMGGFSSFFVCGDATKNLELMCQTLPDSISVDENINLVTAKQITDWYDITIGGNIPLTTQLLLGNQRDNMKFVVDLLNNLRNPINLLKPNNFILSPGCDMPYDTPIENVIGIVQAVRNPDQIREMLVDYHSKSFEEIEVSIPDYSNLKTPLVEVFTLDSDTCAACGYMLGAAQRSVGELNGQVDLIEYKFTKPENVARVMKMGIKNLPSLYINGKLKYSSIIPGNNELLTEIKKFL